MKPIKRKAFAYITQGDQLLILAHPEHPEAGLQVPKGTLETGETPEDGVLREAFEETGLTGLRLNDLLGEQTRDMADFDIDEIQERYFFHLICSQETPPRWRHQEDDPSDGSAPGIPFELYWVPLDAVPELIEDFALYLPLLRVRMAGNEKEV